MTATINASTSSGLITTADTSGVLQFQSNGTAAAGVSSSNFQMNSGYGSVATAYGCRAWVNFDGTGTPAIRDSGNVTSITDNGTGDYSVNFTTAMPDADYSVVVSSSNSQTFIRDAAFSGANPTTSAVRVATRTSTPSYSDTPYVCVSIFR